MVNKTKKIYAIQHNKTKRIYIGSSIRPEERYMNHIYNLRTGKHPVEDMQEDFDKHGENYSFFILDEDMGFNERHKEYELMRKYNTTERGLGYNYKEKEKAYSKASMPVLSRLPIDVSETEEFSKIKNSYTTKIINMISGCNDISLLDLVCKVLEKSLCNCVQEEE